MKKTEIRKRIKEALYTAWFDSLVNRKVVWAHQYWQRKELVKNRYGVSIARGGVVVAKEYYYFINGRTFEKWLKKVLRALKPLKLSIGKTECSNHRWKDPSGGLKNAYFEARVEIKELSE